MSFLQIVKLTTEEDDEVLEIISKFKKAKSDIFHLFVNGKSIYDIAKDLNRKYNGVSPVLNYIKVELHSDAN